MSKLKNSFSIFLFFFGMIFPGMASINDSLMKRGNQAYQKENYEEAVNYYLQIAHQGNEGSILYYNLGNAYYKAHQLPEAILWYERALRLAPSNEDIKHNIAFVNQKIVDKIEYMPELFITRWWNHLSLSMTGKTWSMLSILFCFILVIGIVGILVSRKQWLRSGSLSLSIVALLCAVFSLIFASKETFRYVKMPAAIIMQPVVNAKSTPTESGSDLFVIHEGLKVGITDEVNGWVEIQLPNGEKGWVIKNCLEII
ncbi:MAG: tetratricopeptide repeat protein [Bacteroidales bacterium]